MSNWSKFALLALDHMRWHAQTPYVVTVKEFHLVLIGRVPTTIRCTANDNSVGDET